MPISIRLSVSQKGFANILVVLVGIGLAIFAGVFLWSNIQHGNFGIKNDQDKLKQKEKKFEQTVNNPQKEESAIYPNTDNPPTLTLYFGKEKKVGISDDLVLETGQFGTWEGGGHPTPFKQGLEPNSEMEINLKVGEYPIYSFTKGIITNIDSSEQGEVTIKYGRKYALKHMHIKNLDKNLKIGDKIEVGQLLGYTHTASLGDGSLTFSFLEIELDKLISSRAARAISAFDYFDLDSKSALEKIRKVAPRDPKPSWVASFEDKNESWIAYTGKAETWADMHKIGFEGDLESFEEFAKNNNLEWVLNN
ncbi:MAG: hypothetical protein Q8P92_03670 [Candidatus Daviesbacteria bacterium]|nr:hypothetical protein [Candidatus Daviesbacteria bacterium]